MKLIKGNALPSPTIAHRGTLHLAAAAALYYLGSTFSIAQDRGGGGEGKGTVFDLRVSCVQVRLYCTE